MGRLVTARALRLGSLLCLLACAAPPAPAATVTRLGFWNLRRLGLDAGKDVPLLCSLARQHFDVLGLVEVMNDDATGDVAALRACLAQELVLLETAAAAPAGSPYAEHAWLAVRPGHAAPCAGAAFAGLAAPPASGSAPFLRPPVFTCLRLQGGPALALGVYHARWAGGDAQVTARELDALPAAMAAAGAALGGGGPAAVAVLGDLNLPPAQVALHTGLAPHTHGQGSTLGPTGSVTDHLYDQLLVDAGPLSAVSARVLDLREAAGGAATYQRTLSDHLPIVAVLAELGRAWPGPRPHAIRSGLGVTP